MSAIQIASAGDHDGGVSEWMKARLAHRGLQGPRFAIVDFDRFPKYHLSTFLLIVPHWVRPYWNRPFPEKHFDNINGLWFCLLLKEGDRQLQVGFR
jgi:hypothetical protein